MNASQQVNRAFIGPRIQAIQPTNPLDPGQLGPDKITRACRCPKCPPNGDDNGWQEQIAISTKEEEEEEEFVVAVEVEVEVGHEGYFTSSDKE
ncbi:GD15797 [Drosophila simulans]|uniref:GD15797 n=1 Tax=Drosophila simulans TaxID=7240 RepID=B4R581_DROSI|nr:GD15797 [Drosophila simulans]